MAGLPKPEEQSGFLLLVIPGAGVKLKAEGPAQTMQRMLIVDDERDICELLEEFFQSKGFSVVSAFSGEEALDQLGINPPDVVLLDILLPGISGIEVLRRIKELHPHTRVIMVTSLDRVELKTEALRHGAADFVTKPFDFSPTTWAAALTYRSPLS